jgi:hypothetical protein
MTRIVQLRRGEIRRIALVLEPSLRLFRSDLPSTYALASQLAEALPSAAPGIEPLLSDEWLEYDPIYRGQSDWTLQVPIDHPLDPARCLVSGTGLTHYGSARNRAAMHATNAEELTDSMRMFRLGVEKGRPSPGQAGAAPEWFYKGTGQILRGPGAPLEVPGYAEDGGEEAEVAGVYLIASDGTPRRVGFAIGNEFSDHRFEKHNYLNLAGSKLRTCALGPELVLDTTFEQVTGRVQIERNGAILWAKEVRTGEAEMCHSLANIEHHHFKFEAHRRPGDLHVHYFGAYALSFGEGLALQDGDVMSVAFDGLGRALRNPVRVLPPASGTIQVQPLIGAA